jgi:CBS domain-containing protein
MSPRAAWRLEALGYAPVYHYAVGKADWLAAGLPTEGDGPNPHRVAEVMDRAVTTCRPDEKVSEVAARLDRTDHEICVVVNERSVVQGRLRRDQAERADDRLVEDVMEPGPTTIRADAPLAETSERMTSRHVRSLIVSNPDGVLLGVVRNQTWRVPRAEGAHPESVLDHHD